jgi:type III secretion protein N (ATPase)
MVQAPITFERYANRVRSKKLTRIRGRVTELTGLIIKAAVPGVRIGEMVDIDVGDRTISSEVVGFRDKEVMLMPYGRAGGVGPDSEVIPTGRPFSIRCGPPILGRVVNGLGQPIDKLGPLEGHDLEDWGVERDPPSSLERERIKTHIAFGVRAIDGLLTIGMGQRVGLFAGSGVGKSTLMGQIARNCEADVVVSCLIGERGREVKDYIEEALGEEGMKKSVVVVATSDEASLIRQKSAFVATAIAEWFRNQGAKVLLMMDSTTRFARAQREIGLAVGEPPARQGYPPSVFAMLPRLLERSGNSDKGSITALYTVLVAGSDMEEPISDEVRGILDGHIILNRALGARNHWPAIDILPSLSRVMSGIASPEHKQAAAKLRETLATYEKQRDLILLGAYQYGTDPKTDYAIDKIEQVEEFLRQRTEENDNFEETIQRLVSLFE